MSCFKLSGNNRSKASKTNDLTSFSTSLKTHPSIIFLRFFSVNIDIQVDVWTATSQTLKWYHGGHWNSRTFCATEIESSSESTHESEESILVNTERFKERRSKKQFFFLHSPREWCGFKTDFHFWFHMPIWYYINLDIYKVIRNLIDCHKCRSIFIGIHYSFCFNRYSIAAFRCHLIYIKLTLFSNIREQ